MSGSELSKTDSAMDTVPAVARPRSGSQSVERALRVLECFTTANDDLGVSEVAVSTGLAVSTTHRLIRALLEAGLLAQDERSERYHFGPALIAMGQRAEAQLGLDRLLPDMRHLAERTGESVNVGTRLGDEVLIVLHVPSRLPLRFDQPVGSRVAIHASAMGKTILAFGKDPASEVAALGDLRSFTGSTLTSPSELLQDVLATRTRGWAINDGEREAGVRTIGAPLIGQDGYPFAAIAVQGPMLRIPDERIESLAADLTTTAAGLARKTL